MEQIERDRIVTNFRVGAYKMLITSDLLGRGVDFQQVSFVVNFDIPRNTEEYIHRFA